VDDIEGYAKQIPSFRFGYRTDSGLSYQLVTSAFVHVGWLHLIGNMLFLWLTGAALEDRWGRARFGAFYVAGAVVSALGFAASHSGSAVNLVGASGAVSALMGAFLVFFARTQIHFVYWFGRGVGRFDAVAYVVLPLWLGEQVFFALLASDSGTASVAFSAHIAGFAFGVVVALVANVLARKPVEETAAKAVAASAASPPPGALPQAIALPPPQAIAPPPPRPIEPPKTEPVEPGTGPRFLT
jgi:membrane associated rhomboid family serine protease